MTIGILVVVAERQIAQLPFESLSTSIVDAGRAIAVAAPIADALDGAVEVVVVGQHRAALAHGHVVGRIEAERGQVAEGSSLAGAPARARGVAVVLDEPEVVLLAKGADRVEIEGIA